MKQGFVGYLTSPTRIDGSYVHFNVSSFTTMLLEKSKPEFISIIFFSLVTLFVCMSAIFAMEGSTS
jgi:hypothetical protein